MNFNPNKIIALNSASFVIYLLFSSCYGGGSHSNCKIQNKLAGKEAIVEAQSQSKLRSEFLQVLRSRRPTQGSLTIKIHSLINFLDLAMYCATIILIKSGS